MEKQKIKLPVLSYSKVTTYYQCPKKYKLSYIDKLPRKSNIFGLLGSFAHQILEYFHETYLNDDTKDIPYEKAMKISFDKALKEYKDKLDKEKIDEVYQMMLDYLTIYVNEKEEDKPIILSVEKKIWAPVDNEIVLYGYIDRVQRDKDGLLHVIDYKTTKDPKYLKDRMQLLLYGYSLAIDDNSIEKIRTSYILLKHKMRYMTEEHTREELIAAKDNLLSKWRKIIEDKLFRATPLKFKCTYCDFLDECDEGKSAVFGSKKYFGKTSW